jgi:hypothetical protein
VNALGRARQALAGWFFAQAHEYFLDQVFEAGAG